MSYAVKFTTGARQDLLKIYRYIKSAGSPEAAKKNVRTAIKNLQQPVSKS
ncbi:hypothetical protein D1AOALGA4SA_694 [Olavius algarvensis Delta 1 endosymbiont]|nr:hypothetical protein D1AOALGA4SA_694 [Olavius algarvensis Delta 1 endosymbiont]